MEQLSLGPETFPSNMGVCRLPWVLCDIEPALPYKIPFSLPFLPDLLPLDLAGDRHAFRLGSAHPGPGAVDFPLAIPRVWGS